MAVRGCVIRDLIATSKALGGGWQIRAKNGVLPATLLDDMGTRTDCGGLLQTEPPQTPESETLRRPDW